MKRKYQNIIKYAAQKGYAQVMSAELIVEGKEEPIPFKAIKNEDNSYEVLENPFPGNRDKYSFKGVVAQKVWEELNKAFYAEEQIRESKHTKGNTEFMNLFS